MCKPPDCSEIELLSLEVYFGVRKDSPQKAAFREMMSTHLKDIDVKIKDGTDVDSIMRNMMSVS